MMKKPLALVLALMLMLSCAALAEPSTSYTVALMDPIITMDGNTIDMTGMDLELSGYVSDIGVFSADAMINVGENFENTALYALAQLDQSGPIFSVEGLSNFYTVNLDELAGTSVTPYLSMLGMIPANTLLNTMEMPQIEFNAAERYMMVEEMLSAYNDGGAIAISRQESQQMAEQIKTMVSGLASSLSGEFVDLQDVDFSFDLSGTLTGGQDGYLFSGAGNFYAEDEAVAYDITLDDSDAATDFVFHMYEPEGTEVFTAQTHSVTSAAGTQSSFDMNMADGADVETYMQGAYTATPVAGSNQVDHVFEVSLPEGLNVAGTFSENTNGDDLGFSLDISATNGVDTPLQFYLYYMGEKSADEYGTVISGYVSTGCIIEENHLMIDTGLLLMSTALDTADWVYDSTGAIDIMNISDAESSAAMMGLMGIVGNAYTLVSEHVPGLAPILEEALGGMM